MTDLPKGYTVTKDEDGWRARCDGWTGLPRETFQLARIDALAKECLRQAEEKYAGDEKFLALLRGEK